MEPAPTLTDFVFNRGELLIRTLVFFDEEPRRKAVIAAGATCRFFLQQADDRDKLRAIVLEMADDLIQ